MADAYVQVPPDSTGTKIDTTEIDRGDQAETIVERQRVDVPGLERDLSKALQDILVEMRVHSILLGWIVKFNDIDGLRSRVRRNPNV